MAKKQGKKKQTKFEAFMGRLNAALEKVTEKMGNLLLKPLFFLIAFIFWRNKYCKQFWKRKLEWWKTMRRLRSRAQKEIILTAIIPTLEMQGFQRDPRPTSWWGWNYCIQGYDYPMVRLKDHELQFIEIDTTFGKPYFKFEIWTCYLSPSINNIAELAKYDFDLFFPEDTKANVRKYFIKYKLKSFSSEKELKRKVARLKIKFEKWAADIDREFVVLQKTHIPAYIDINKKLRERGYRCRKKMSQQDGCENF